MGDHQNFDSNVYVSRATNQIGEMKGDGRAHTQMIRTLQVHQLESYTTSYQYLQGVL